jgi:hypothetical protein
MLSLGKVLGLTGKKAAPKQAPRPRVRLGCEQMEDRVTPAWVTFDIVLNDGMTARGIVEFDDQSALGFPDRQLEIMDFVLYVNNTSQQYIQLYQVYGYASMTWLLEDFENPVFNGLTVWAAFQEGVAEISGPGQYNEVFLGSDGAYFYTWDWQGVAASITYSQLYFNQAPPGW